MSAPGSPTTSSRNSPVPRYLSSYNDHFGLARPSSAPPATQRYEYAYSAPSSPTIGQPSTPRYDPSTTRYEASTPRDVDASPTSRHAKYAWNKNRNPLLDGDDQKSTAGKKQVPTYFDHLAKHDEDTRRLSRKSRPEPTPFLIDPSRAGIPTLIQRIRTREEDLFHRKRPSTAPSPITRDDMPPAGAASSRTPGRRPCQIEKFNVRRNPLIESGEEPIPRRTVLGFNKESQETEFELGKKTLLIPPSLQKVNRTTENYIPGELPPAPTIRLRTNHPDDSDVFNATHPLVSPTAPQLMGAIEKEQAREEQEKQLDKAYQERVTFYNDEIKKFKAKAKLKSGKY